MLHIISRTLRFLRTGAVFPTLVLTCGLLSAQSSSVETETAAEVELDPLKQKHIWDLEHITFVIETYFGKPFTAALVARDRKTMLASFVGEGFRGEVLAPSGGQRRSGSLVSEVRRSAATSPRRRVDAAGAVDALLESTSGFSRIDKSRLQVTYIDRVEGAEHRWLADFQLSAIGQGAEGSPREYVSQLQIEFRFDDDEGGRHAG